MPLVSSFWLATKKERKVWLEPVVDRVAKKVTFDIKSGNGAPLSPPKIGRGATFRCLVCDQPADEKSIRQEFRAKNDSQQLMAIVAEGRHGRLYLPANSEHTEAANSASPPWKPDEEMNQYNSNLVSGRGYGIKYWSELFTPRQLTALTTLSDLVPKARDRVLDDAIAAGLPNDDTRLNAGGNGACAYADAVATYLSLAVDRNADYGSVACSWHSGPKMEALRNTFARQAIAMAWDYAEGNPFSRSSGNWTNSFEWPATVLERLYPSTTTKSEAKQLDATAIKHNNEQVLISTDPPYYDNIDYADLSDFFYVWLRRSLSNIYPELFGTMLVPKTQELIAAPYRFDGSRDKARHFFEDGLGSAFSQMRVVQHPDYPLTVYYAFRQAESEEDDSNDRGNGISIVASTGWETMLEGLLKAGFTITGTWPMRTELSNRPIASGRNALASSIVLVCRPRPTDAPLTTRRDFLNALKRELPTALKNLQHGNIAPVDLAQATIGPGMAVFSRYSRVMEADGSAMRVRTALQLINQSLDEVLAEQEGEFDADTRWALAWFEQFGIQEGLYGVAEILSKAKNTTVAGLAETGVLIAKAGKVRLLSRDQLSDHWDPVIDSRITVWKVTQHLIGALERDGEGGAAALLNRVGPIGEIARDLAYRLYTICERKKWADEALAYNSIVISWPQITQLASQQAAATSAPRQQEMFT